MSYWEERMARAQGVLSDKNIAEINKQMKKYYRSLASQIVNDFEATYDKLLTMKQEGKVLSTADLYRLDRYWEMEAQLQERLKKLHDKSVNLLTNEFKQQFKDIYNSLQFKSLTAFTTIDDAAIDQLIKQVWCADGKSWSQRIWENTQLLQQTLNDELVHCVVTGQPTSKLKKLLQERFNVAYSRSDCLVRTEIAHIQTQAAQQRYQDYGIEEVQVFVDTDERTCPICKQHEGERYPVGSKMPVPFHPNCRCCMLPVVNPNKTTAK